MKTTVFLILALFYSGVLAASSDYERRYLELRDRYQSETDAQQLELLLSFFGISAPEIGESSVEREFFAGISDAGYELIVTARQAETARMVDELNCGKLSVAKLCQILADQPSASAEFIAEQRALRKERELQRKLKRYRAVFDQLSAADQAAVRQFNEIAFGPSMPAVSDPYQELYAALAKEFPQEFRDSQKTDCLVERRDDAALFLLPAEAPAWNDLGPLERCEKTKQHAKRLMLVCPENFDPQDEDKPCSELLSAEDAALAEAVR